MLTQLSSLVVVVVVDPGWVVVIVAVFGRLSLLCTCAVHLVVATVAAVVALVSLLGFGTLSHCEVGC